MSTDPALAEALKSHAADCAEVAALLARHDSPNLRALHWYDRPLAEVVSARGQARTRAWNLERPEQDEIAGNYGIANLWFGPAPGDGITQSGATVWRCEALDSRPWFDGPSAVCAALEGAAGPIIAEYRAAAQALGTHPDNGSLVDRGRWTGMFLYGARGQRNEELCARCPQTAAVLAALPLCTNFGFAMFSGMEPHTHVKAHCGSSNLRLRHHLGLDVPEPAAGRLRVGDEWRHWSEGKAFAFDDSFEHEVVHEGDRARVVLVVDVWHPGLSPTDVEVLAQPVFARFGKYTRGA